MRAIHHNALMLHAQAQNSDPFAKRRADLYIRKGAPPRLFIKAAADAMNARTNGSAVESSGKDGTAFYQGETVRNAFTDALAELYKAMTSVKTVTKRVKRKLRPLVKQAA